MANEKKDSIKKTKNTSKKRISKVEILLRERNVAEWILEGNQPIDIVNSIQKLWNIQQRQAYYYIEGALELLYRNIDQTLHNRLAFHVSTRLKMYKDISEDKSLKARDKYALMLTTLKDIAQLEGLYQERIKIETEHTEIYSFTLNLGDSEQQEQIKEGARRLPSSSNNQLPESNS